MAKTSAALDFKSATLYALRAVLHTADTQALLAALAARMDEAGSFYRDEPVALDAQGLEEAPDWAALVTALREHGLHPIGVQADAALLDAAAAAGLAPLDLSAAPAAGPRPSAADPGSAAKAAAAAAQTPEPAAHAPARTTSPATAGISSRAPAPAAAASETLLIQHPLRSGQRIYAKGRDLIVLGMVSQGAEVIADGHVHVYGPLRGKAMAGAHGRTDAMIFTTQLDPELLAVAGVYRVVETRLPDTLHNRPARVSLEGDTLRIESLIDSGHYL